MKPTRRKTLPTALAVSATLLFLFSWRASSSAQAPRPPVPAPPISAPPVSAPPISAPPISSPPVPAPAPFNSPFDPPVAADAPALRPPSAEAPVEPGAPGAPQLSPEVADELLKLRQSLGSPLRGTLFDDGGGDQELFLRMLRDASREVAPKSLPPADEEAAPRPLPPPPQGSASPPSLPPPHRDAPPVSGVCQSLRQAAVEAVQHAAELDAAGQTVRAARLRKLARRMQREALEIQETSPHASSTIGLPPPPVNPRPGTSY